MVLTHISGLFTCCSHVLKLRRAIDRPTADHLTYRERTEKCMNPQDLVKRFLQVAVNCDAVHRAVLFSPCFWHKPTDPGHSFLFRPCVAYRLYTALSTVFHSIESPDNSLLSLSVLPVLFLPYLSFQLYIFLCESLLHPRYNPLWLTGLDAPINLPTNFLPWGRQLLIRRLKKAVGVLYKYTLFN